MFVVKGENLLFYLYEGTYKVGKVGDVVLNDSSVNERHAEIEVKKKKIYLTPCNSNYSTKLNGNKLPAQKPVIVNVGDLLEIGDISLTIEEEKIVTCMTGLKDKDNYLKNLVAKIGGTLTKDWTEDVTHLTTNQVHVTLKVLFAVINDKKIVTSQYWIDYLKNLLSRQPPPDASDYFPPCAEHVLNPKYLKYNPNRKKIFEGKTFFFLDRKQQLQMKEVIEQTGGNCQFIQKAPSKLAIEAIIIDPENHNKLTAELKNFIQQYQNNNMRLIPMQEIAMGILMCSCKEHCNPNFNRLQAVFASTSQKPEPSKVLVGKTQTQALESMNESCKRSMCVEETQFSYKKVKLDSEIDIVEHNLKETISVKPSASGIFPLKRPNESTLEGPPKKFKESPVVQKNPFSSIKTQETTTPILTEGENPFQNIINRKPKKETTNSHTNTFFQNKVNTEQLTDKQPTNNNNFEQKPRVSVIDRIPKAPISIKKGTLIQITPKEQFDSTSDDETTISNKTFSLSFLEQVESLSLSYKKGNTSVTAVWKSKHVPNFKKFVKTPVKCVQKMLNSSVHTFNNDKMKIDYGDSGNED